MTEFRQRKPPPAIDTRVRPHGAVSAPVDASARWISRRTLALSLLVLQNSSVSLLTRLSRTASSSAELYNPAMAVFTAELVKLSISLAMLGRERASLAQSKGKQRGIVGEAIGAFGDVVRNQKWECLKLAVPAALYALQNTLLYTALSNLDAATYQTTYQLKLLTTALFSIAFFRRSLSGPKWLALFLLTLGVAVVQLDTIDPTSTSSRSASHATNQGDPKKGFAAILAACISSGLAGGWFEYVLKAPSAPPPSESPAPVSPASSSSPSTPKSPSAPPPRLRANSPSLWARNLQLSVPSLVFSFAGVLLSGPVQAAWRKAGVEGIVAAVSSMWDGFSPLVWSVVANQAVGGLLVAMVVREADSVAKGFATSIAIVVSTLASALLFQAIPGRLFVLGASLVISSTVLYSFDKS
ncbi:hypothetical protein JCM8097_003843 [Rhodosporidiobolus ruineniae]